MRYIIDTNILIRLITGEYVSHDVYSIVTDYENQIYVSSESVKEFIHLLYTRKFKLSRDYKSADVFDIIEKYLNYQIKYVTKQHLQKFSELTPADGHNDPSDHVIISQAITEKLPLISSDLKFPQYENQGLNLIMNE